METRSVVSNPYNLTVTQNYNVSATIETDSILSRNQLQSGLWSYRYNPGSDQPVETRSTYGFTAGTFKGQNWQIGTNAYASDNIAINYLTGGYKGKANVYWNKNNIDLGLSQYKIRAVLNNEVLTNWSDLVPGIDASFTRNHDQYQPFEWPGYIDWNLDIAGSHSNLTSNQLLYSSFLSREDVSIELYLEIKNKNSF